MNLLLNPPASSGHQHPGRGGGGRLEVRLLPGGRCPPGPDDRGRRGMRINLGEDKKEIDLPISGLMGVLLCPIEWCSMSHFDNKVYLPFPPI